jgi:hypothetical protein
VSHPGYIISSNVFLIAPPTYGIITAGAKQITVISNHFDGGGIALGTPGQQGTDYNRDFLVANNIFTNVQIAIFLAGSGENRIEDVLATNNVASVNINFAMAGERAGSWSTNVVFRHNTANKGLSTTWGTGQYFLDDESNSFPPYQVLDNSGMNAITYARGMRHNLYPLSPNAKFYLDTPAPGRIPAGAILRVANYDHSATLYTSTNLVNPITMPPGYSAVFLWSSGVWRLTSSISSPGNLHVVPVSPGS